MRAVADPSRLKRTGDSPRRRGTAAPSARGGVVVRRRRCRVVASRPEPTDSLADTTCRGAAPRAPRARARAGAAALSSAAVASGLAARPLRRRGRLARRRGDERRLERRERARLGLGLGRRGGAAEVYLLAEALVAGEFLGDAHGRAAQAPREEGSECGAVF